ncbi:MAG: hypothetical protein SFX73_02505 [Kofleriaceae bacterium]|nr:hypothetical protein [Kofleriaceae bacterium]
MRRASLLLAFIAACGGPSSAPPAPVATAISAVAPPASPADLELARVNGKPVWASCVVEQLARHKRLNADTALQECIAFELMAQEAVKRHLDTFPEVVDATRTAMVSRFIATEFEAKYKSPADLGSFMSKIIDKESWRLSRPELRASSYIRIPLAENVPPEVEARAKSTAQTIADAVASERGLADSNFVEIAQRAVPGVLFEHAEVPAKVRTGLDKTYGDVLFAVPEVGSSSGPVRTKWGYDVILWTGGLPAKETTREELEAELFPEIRRAYFIAWVGQMVKERGIHIEVDPSQLSDEAQAP